MAQNITLLGASYSNVPAVQLPKTGGGTAKFTDTTPTTASASDVASGKIFFDASGNQQTGTSSGGGGSGGVEISQDQDGFIILPEEASGGGGGGSGWRLLASDTFAVNTTSTSGIVVATMNVPEIVDEPLLMVVVRGAKGNVYGTIAHIGTDTIITNPNKTLEQSAFRVMSYYSVYGFPNRTINTYASGANTYGVCPTSISSSGAITISATYNSSYTGTINDTYSVKVYALEYPSGDEVPTRPY